MYPTPIPTDVLCQFAFALNSLYHVALHSNVYTYYIVQISDGLMPLRDSFLRNAHAPHSTQHRIAVTAWLMENSTRRECLTR